MIFVIVDKDAEDCIELKHRLESIATSEGLTTKTEPGIDGRYQVINRIAMEELEAWFFGDPAAIRAAFPRMQARLEKRSRYRDPDAIVGGTWEALERELMKSGYYLSGMPKIEVARLISSHMDPDSNRSRSFRTFVESVRSLSAFDKFCQDWVVQHILESIAHPQTLGKTEQRHNMMKNYLWQVLPDLDIASRDDIKGAVHDWVQRHNFDSPHEGWITYRLGDWVKKKKIHFLPYLRFVCHRD